MWPDSQETQELLYKAGEGDEHAVNMLLDRHRDVLRRAVSARLDRAVASRVDASDIVQEVLIDASRRLADYIKSPGMPFQLWLRHIARDRIIDAHRRHREADKRTVDREQPIARAATSDRSAASLEALLSDQALTPAAAAIRQELQDQFRSVIESMDEADRDILFMRHFEQLSNSEVADALGLSQPAAGMRYLRAIRKLRELLDAPSDDQSE